MDETNAADHDRTHGSQTTDEAPPGHDRQDGTRPSPPLTRDTSAAVLGGVCAGIGRYLRIDPLLVRIIAIVLAFTGGAGVIAYFVAWFVIPGDDGQDPAEEIRRAVRSAPTWLQVLGVVVVALFVAGQLDGLPTGLAWGAVLIGAGIVLYRDTERTEGRRQREHSASSTAHPASSTADPASSTADLGASTADLGASGPPTASWGAGAGGAWGHPAPPSPPKPPKEPSILGRLTIAAILLWCGAAALLDNAGVLSWTPRHYVAVATVITGLGLVVGAWWGRARSLILLGLLLLPLLLLAGFPAGSARGGVGERVHRPASIEELRPAYELLAGQMTLDLTRLDLGGADVGVRLRQGFGELDVIVPPGVSVAVRGRVLAGDSSVLGRTIEGAAVTLDNGHRGAQGAGTIDLDIHLGAGQLTVRHPR